MEDQASKLDQMKDNQNGEVENLFEDQGEEIEIMPVNLVENTFPQENQQIIAAENEHQQEMIFDCEQLSDSHKNQHYQDPAKIQNEQPDIQSFPQNHQELSQQIIQENIFPQEDQQNTKVSIEQQSNLNVQIQQNAQTYDDTKKVNNQSEYQTLQGANNELADLHDELVIRIHDPQSQKQGDQDTNQNIEEEMIETPAEKEKRILDSIKVTQINTAQTLQNITKTLASVEETLKGVAITQQKLDNFSKGFTDAMTSMASKLSSIYDEPDNFGPEITDLETVTRDIIRCSNVIILLSQQCSTIKNQDEYVNVLRSCYQQNRLRGTIDEYWNFYHTLKLESNNQSNDLYRSLARTLLSVNKDGQVMSIASEIIDGQLKKQFGGFQAFSSFSQGFGQEEPKINLNNEELVFEFNGNINKLVCENKKCETQLFEPQHSYQEFDPRCPQCHQVGVASVLEPQPPTSLETIISQIDQYTCVISLGSQFSNPLMLKLQQTAIENNSLLVEISECPMIEFGRVKQLIGDPLNLALVLCENIIENFY